MIDRIRAYPPKEHQTTIGLTAGLLHWMARLVPQSRGNLKLCKLLHHFPFLFGNSHELRLVVGLLKLKASPLSSWLPWFRTSNVSRSTFCALVAGCRLTLPFYWAVNLNEVDSCYSSVNFRDAVLSLPAPGSVVCKHYLQVLDDFETKYAQNPITYSYSFYYIGWSTSHWPMTIP